MRSAAIVDRLLQATDLKLDAELLSENRASGGITANSFFRWIKPFKQEKVLLTRWKYVYIAYYRNNPFVVTRCNKLQICYPMCSLYHRLNETSLLPDKFEWKSERATRSRSAFRLELIYESYTSLTRIELFLSLFKQEISYKKQKIKDNFVVKWIKGISF